MKQAVRLIPFSFESPGPFLMEISKGDPVGFLLDILRIEAIAKYRSCDQRALAPDFIYVVECEGNYKIGFSKDVKERMKQLETGAGAHIVRPNLTLITHFLGGLVEEQALHKQFAECRINGEWFRPNARMKQWIKNLPKQLLP